MLILHFLLVSSPPCGHAHAIPHLSLASSEINTTRLTIPSSSPSSLHTPPHLPPLPLSLFIPKSVSVLQFYCTNNSPPPVLVPLNLIPGSSTFLAFVESRASSSFASSSSSFVDNNNHRNFSRIIELNCRGSCRIDQSICHIYYYISVSVWIGFCTHLLGWPASDSRRKTWILFDSVIEFGWKVGVFC